MPIGVFRFLFYFVGAKSILTMRLQYNGIDNDDSSDSQSSDSSDSIPAFGHGLHYIPGVSGWHEIIDVDDSEAMALERRM